MRRLLWAALAASSSLGCGEVATDPVDAGHAACCTPGFYYCVMVESVDVILSAESSTGCTGTVEGVQRSYPIALHCDPFEFCVNGGCSAAVDLADGGFYVPDSGGVSFHDTVCNDFR